MDGITLVNYLGHGFAGSVFEIEFEGERAALKLQYGPPNDIASISNRGTEEYIAHKALREIGAFAQPIEDRNEIIGDYVSLGLDCLGLPLKEMTYSWGYEPIFSGVFIFELFTDLRDISEINGDPNYFELLNGVHERSIEKGYTFGRDSEFFSRDSNPIILDLGAAERLGLLSKDERLKSIGRTNNRINGYEDIYCP